ncbi:MAG: hypothetical protein B7X10_01665, partial [Burkholderiales bacterium 21-58-4]
MKIDYENCSTYDEMIDKDGKPRPIARELYDHIAALGPEDLSARVAAVDAAIMTSGITFTVYTEAGNIDRAWPFDVIPRIIDAREWAIVENGLKQRLSALNRFITDIYNEQKIVKDGIFPIEVLKDSKNFRASCVGVMPRFGVWA